jgi:succinyl-diaminopimelate desuccinylase
MDEQEKQAWKRVDGKTDQILERIRKLIAVDTSVPPGRNYDALVAQLEPEFQRLGFETERVTIPDELIAAIPLPLDGPRVNLVAQRRVGREPVTIYAHMDVVPIEGVWRHPPFNAELVDGKIFGRGTSDLKGAIASLLTAVEVMDESGITPNYDLNVCLCTDEEIGGYPGIWHLTREGYVKGHMLCLAGGQEARLGLAAAGSVDVTITVIGKSAQSGTNYLGVNAIDAMLPILQELAELKVDVESRESTVLGVKHKKAPSRYMTPMFNFSVIKAGVKSNIVPAACTLLINRRYIPEENYGQVREEILEAVERGRKRSVALDVKVDFFHATPAMKLIPGPHMRKMQEALMLVRGYTVEDFTAVGSSDSSDMAYVQQELGWTDIPFCGPGRIDSNAHGADEFVRLDDVKAHVKELIHYLAF